MLNGALLLSGPSGTGKSLVLTSIVKEAKIHIENILWFNIFTSEHYDIETDLKALFKRAVENSPSIIVIDDYNYLCPKTQNASLKHVYTKVFSILSSLIDKYRHEKILILAASNNSDYDNILKSSQNFKEIKFNIPNKEERKEIIIKLLRNVKHNLTNEDIDEFCQSSHGFTGLDIDCSIKEAALLYLKRDLENKNGEEKFIDNSIILDYCDLQKALQEKKINIIDSEIPIKKVHWNDIRGTYTVVKKLKEIIELPLKYPETFKAFGISPSRGVLLFGPPGCGKTMIARAIATECNVHFISKSCKDLCSKYVGESEKKIRELFLYAKERAPCIIFLDEIDSLAWERGSHSGDSGVGDRMLCTLLDEIDGCEEMYGVMILAATNRPDKLDKAFTREGRLGNLIYIPLPNIETREEIFKSQFKKRIISEDVNIKTLAQLTCGYSGAEIINICNEAALNVLAENQTKSFIFNMAHFQDAIKAVKPRTSKEIIRICENFNNQYGKFNVK